MLLVSTALLPSDEHTAETDKKFYVMMLGKIRMSSAVKFIFTFNTFSIDNKTLNFEHMQGVNKIHLTYNSLL